MRRSLAGSALITLSLAGAVACTGPQATKGLTYQQVDGELLAKTTLAVATSRTTFASHMLGSTLLIDDDGRGKRLDNDGMNTVTLAYDGTVLGFSDIGHDYLLGTDRPVRTRKQKAPRIGSGSYLYRGRLVSLFNGGFTKAGYRLAVAESDAPLREELGLAYTTALCDDGIWAAILADRKTAEPSARLDILRIAPTPDRSWSVDAGTGVLSFSTMTCQGHRLIGVGERSNDEDHVQQVLVSTDVLTGQTRIVDLDRPRAPSSETPRFPAATLKGRDLFVVQTPPDSSDRAELWRINLRDGRGQLVTKVSGVDPYSNLVYRFDGNLLYVLDPTEDEPSVLTAINLDTGKTVGRLEMDPLNKMVNGPHTSFEDTQFVRDFVVLQPPEKW